MALITPSKKEDIRERIESRIPFVEDGNTVTLNCYGTLLTATDEPFENTDDFRLAIAENIPPDILFSEELVRSEGTRFFSIIRAIFSHVGIYIKPSRKTKLPLQIAQALYLNEGSDEMTEEEKSASSDLYRSAVNLYSNVSIPRDPMFQASNPKMKQESYPVSGLKERMERLGLTKQEEPTEAQESNGDPQERPVFRQPMFSEEQMAAAQSLRNDRQEYHPMDSNDISVVSTRYSEAKAKTSFVSTIMKHKEKEENKFTGTDSRSWICHVQNYEALAKSHDVTCDETLLELVQWTLGPGPKMSWERYMKGEQASWDGYKLLMSKRHNSSSVHARTRESIMAISLKEETLKQDTGPTTTRNSRATTRTVDKILKLAKDLPESERTESHLLGFLRMAIRGVEFTKFAQITLADETTSFDELSLAVQTAAQVEDSNSGPPQSRALHGTFLTDLSENNPSILSDLMDIVDWEHCESYQINYTDRRLGRAPRRRSTKCGDNKRFNGEWKGQRMTCHDCRSPKHLKYHRSCPLEQERRKNGSSVLSGVKNQLASGASVAEVLLCLGTAFDDVIMTTEVKSDINEDDTELFETNFAERLAHSLESKLDNDFSLENTKNTNSIKETEIFTATSIDCANIQFQSSDSFRGAVIDTGAAKSCVGEKQAMAYSKWAHKPFVLSSSSTSFKLGDVVHPSLGELSVKLPTSSGDICIGMDVISANTPMLLGLDVLDRHGLLVDTKSNFLRHNSWKMKIVRDQGHLWIRWPCKVNYTEAQLRKLHRHFMHPSASKLYALLKKIDPTKLSKGTLRTLKDIQLQCEPCQIIDRKQLSFQVGTPNTDSIVFNREISMDLMKLGGRTALHVVDTGTHFGAAKILQAESMNSVWNALLDCWILVYAGMPDMFFVDQGSAFTGNDFSKLCDENGVVLKTSGVQHHNGLSMCERYHAPLRRIFRKIEIDFPNLDIDMVLSLSVKAMNDTMGPEGLIPSMLVFGIMPRYAPAGLNCALPQQSDRMRAMAEARDTFYRIVNKLRVQRAIRAKVPEAADRIFKPGDLVRVFREDDRCYSDPTKIIEIDENNKMATVKIGKRRKQKYSVSQLKPYLGVVDDNESVMRHIGSAMGPWRSDYQKPSNIPVNITEIIEKADPRAECPKMKAAIENEIEGLVKRGTFKVVRKSDIPNSANVLKGRFVLAIKDPSTKEERYKARFVIGGHRDKDKAILVHASPNIQQSSVRILLAVAAIMDFQVWSEDISQAYLQGSTELMREIYLDASKEFNLKPGEILKLLKPLYGLSDSGDRWHYTLKTHHLDDLEMTPTKGDLSLYTRHIGNKLSGLSGVYVDDTIQAGDKDFKDWANQTSKRFDSREKKTGKGTFAGMEYCQDSTKGDVMVGMDVYISKLGLLSIPCTFEEFASMRAQHGWTTHCRPDVACAVAKSTQITKSIFDTTKHGKESNKITRHLRKYSLKIVFPKLDRKTLHIRAYSDASHANNIDLSSQLGIIITLCDSNDQCSVLYYRSYKCKRITRSALASECHALADCFDFAFMMKHDLEGIFRQVIPIQIMTDSRSLFQVIVKSSRTAERRLMIDIAACRESYEKHEIADIGLIRSEYNLADCLTKIMMPKQLMEAMATGRLQHPIEQWIIRKEA